MVSGDSKTLSRWNLQKLNSTVQYVRNKKKSTLVENTQYARKSTNARMAEVDPLNEELSAL